MKVRTDGKIVDQRAGRCRVCECADAAHRRRARCTTARHIRGPASRRMEQVRWASQTVVTRRLDIFAGPPSRIRWYKSSTHPALDAMPSRPASRASARPASVWATWGGRSSSGGLLFTVWSDLHFRGPGRERGDDRIEGVVLGPAETVALA